jgi:poly(A) polymerase
VSDALPPQLVEIQQRAVRSLLEWRPDLLELGELFRREGFELAAVGGCVRDAVLHDFERTDIDLTTDAKPDTVLSLVRNWADAVWDVGIRFGTVGLRRGDQTWEITTYRTDSYSGHTRKPDIAYGDSLAGDLVRRDFTINAMAVRLPSGEFVDEHGGLIDLAARRLRTPGTPEQSFSDDPLRMMRAARFASQLDASVSENVRSAMGDMAGRLGIVSAERVRDELSRLLLGNSPRRGLTLMVDSGLAEHVLPELPLLRLEIDEHHHHKDVYEHTLTVLEQAIMLEDSGPDLVLRLAALMHDIGKPRTRRFTSGGGVSFHHHEVVGARMTAKRLRRLRFSNDVVDDVSRLVELHLRFHGYGTGEWTDSAVRRYVRDAGPLLPRLHRLTRADCTTRNRRRAEALQRAYDGLERRIARLAVAEELAAIRPELDGNQIMALLGVPPGRDVGRAYQFLLELRLDHGPMGTAAAEQALLTWWADRGGSGPGPGERPESGI